MFSMQLKSSFLLFSGLLFGFLPYVLSEEVFSQEEAEVLYETDQAGYSDFGAETVDALEGGAGVLPPEYVEEQSEVYRGLGGDLDKGFMPKMPSRAMAKSLGGGVKEKLSGENKVAKPRTTEVDESQLAKAAKEKQGVDKNILPAGQKLIRPAGYYI